MHDKEVIRDLTNALRRLKLATMNHNGWWIGEPMLPAERQELMAARDHAASSIKDAEKHLEIK